jgi:hypothetical protein
MLQPNVEMVGITTISPEKQGALISWNMDKLALTWCIGIGIGCALCLTFIFWIAYRCFFLYSAYQAGNYPFILTELKTDLLISAGYFGIAGILRKMGYI